ncbi:hypothetical protein B0A55_11643 [Friedmanniomyces simplex]|uniref:Uncharacterized protein n=1 Tax=Friedmanniomyces simplex TaxID=329884 RepID=A0A4U0WMR1_9PEZI|nr:hypothetical protein B0A55_11643 [Friedmanniomyces simplex]
MAKLYVLEELSSTESRSRSRVEECVMDQDNNTNISTTLGKVSICANTDTGTDSHTHKLLSDFESWSGCKTIGKILNQVTYVRSVTDRDEIMVLSLREIVDLCKGMHRSPLRFECNGIVLPEAGDRWTDMDWTINRNPTRVKFSSAGASVHIPSI